MLSVIPSTTGHDYSLLIYSGNARKRGLNLRCYESYYESTVDQTVPSLRTQPPSTVLRQEIHCHSTRELTHENTGAYDVLDEHLHTVTITLDTEQALNDQHYSDDAYEASESDSSQRSQRVDENETPRVLSSCTDQIVPTDNQVIEE